MTLRPYQLEARDRVFKAWSEGLRRLALVLPTGAGKTVVFSEIIRCFREQIDAPVLVLAHREELLSQAAEKIHHWVPGIPVGVVKAAQNQVHRPIIVASQQTLARGSRIARLPKFGLVVVDECHRSMGPSYHRVLEELGCLSPNGPLTLGVTATFTREDSKRLTDFYQAVPFALDIVELIEAGYLAHPRFKRVLIEGLDLSGIPMSRLAEGKDLAAGELGEAMDRAGAPGVVAAAYVRHARHRSGMVFTPTVSSAEHVAQALRDVGIPAAMLSGKAGATERKRVLEDFNAGRLQVITNAALLGEGVDAPITSCVVVARPTMSKTLFRQMVGRGLRLHPGKEDCLVLDVVGATGRNDLKTLNDITDLEIDVREDEDVLDAAKRVVLPGISERIEAEGDGMVSGSLLAIDVDPWALEHGRGRPKNQLGEPMSDEELAELARLREEERAAAEAEKELRAKRRYKHVPMRSGWFLRTPSDRWFIELNTAAGQKGFLTVFELPDTRHVVALKMDEVDDTILTVTPDASEATAYAVNFTLGVIDQAMERYQVDPDANWRRKPAPEKLVNWALEMAAFDEEEYHYKGQVMDFIVWGRLWRHVDRFAEKITAEAMKSGRVA